jgi:hypothetical protein
MRVAPRGQIGIQAQVLVADIVAAQPAALTVNDHDLAMVSEVELEPVPQAAGRAEGRNFCAGAAEFLAVSAG